MPPVADPASCDTLAAVEQSGVTFITTRYVCTRALLA